MAYWLAKTEPESFSYGDLEKLGQDRWNGVKNFAALKHMKQMKLGDLVFIYHTGKEKQLSEWLKSSQLFILIQMRLMNGSS